MPDNENKHADHAESRDDTTGSGAGRGQGCASDTPVEAAPARSVIAERELEDFLVDNLALIEPGLRLAEIETGSGVLGPPFHRIGRQFETRVGRIDLLCEDGSGAFVVVELKAEQADDAAVGQVLGYVGCVASDEGSGRAVRGILIARGFTDRARSAAHQAGIKLVRYLVEFSFEEA
jgi:RecB family endonuclease NucS